jgi:hypothetical protein
LSANVDLVRSIYADWEPGDFSRTEWADPEIEFEQRAGLALVAVQGVAAMAEAWREFLLAWVDVSTKADQYRELDNERVLVFGQYSGHGKLSGLGTGCALKMVCSGGRSLGKHDLGEREHREGP